MEMSKLPVSQALPSWKKEALCSIHRRLDLGNLVNSGTILHYGCGAGYAIHQLPHAVGFEPNVRKAQQGVIDGSNVFISEDHLHGGFDIIFCHERIVEHSDLSKVIERLGKYQHRHSTVLLAIGKKNPHFSSSRKAVEAEAIKILRKYNYRVVSVEEQYLANYKPMLGFYRWFGMGFYNKIITLLGRLKNDKRFIIKAVVKHG